MWQRFYRVYLDGRVLLGTYRADSADDACRWVYDGHGRWRGPSFEAQAYANVASSTPDGNGDATYTTYHRTDTFERVLDGLGF